MFLRSQEAYYNQTSLAEEEFSRFGSPDGDGLNNRLWYGGTYSHWVRMTSFPICSAVVPWRGSYSDSPMAWIWRVFWSVSWRRRVRYNAQINIIIGVQSPRVAYHNTSGEKAAMYMMLNPEYNGGNVKNLLTLHLNKKAYQWYNACIEFGIVMPIAIKSSGLNSLAILGVANRMRLCIWL